MRNRERSDPRAITTETVRLDGRLVERALVIDKAAKIGRRVIRGAMAPLRVIDRGFEAMQKGVESTFEQD
jgi:hypothetical protein